MSWPSPYPALNAALMLLAVAVLAGAAFYAALPWVVQPLMRALISVRYRVIVKGLENFPRTGPVLLAFNHASWIDGPIIASHAPRRGKAMVNAGLVSGPILKPIAVRAGIIPTPWAGPRAIRAALEAAREQLDKGEAIAIFPEGQISRHGLINPFQRGIEAILKGKEGALVVPGAIDGLWGSNFSYSEGRFYRKRPKGWRRTVAVVFGPAMVPPLTAFEVRQRVVELLVDARELLGPSASLPETIRPDLPRWEHPSLGLLTASTADVVVPSASVHQIGRKDGTVGLPVPGVAIKAVDGDGNPLPPEARGRLLARVAGGTGWRETGAEGSVDRDGYVRLVNADDPRPEA